MAFLYSIDSFLRNDTILQFLTSVILFYFLSRKLLLVSGGMRTPIFTITTLLFSAVVAQTWYRFDTIIPSSLQARGEDVSFHPKLYDGYGETCESVFGFGYVFCGDDGACYNPIEGQLCCKGGCIMTPSDGNFCVGPQS